MTTYCHQKYNLTDIENPLIIEGVSFVSLEEFVKWKKDLERDKDLKDVKLIEEYLQKNKK